MTSPDSPIFLQRYDLADPELQSVIESWSNHYQPQIQDLIASTSPETYQNGAVYFVDLRTTLKPSFLLHEEINESDPVDKKIRKKGMTLKREFRLQATSETQFDQPEEAPTSEYILYDNDQNLFDPVEPGTLIPSTDAEGAEQYNLAIIGPIFEQKGHKRETQGVLLWVAPGWQLLPSQS